MSVLQEIANPKVRPHLRFFPEDCGGQLSEAYQARRWLRELDPGLTTPMIRHKNQDFYIFEPTIVRQNKVCMPIRWFSRGNKMFAYAWQMEPSFAGNGWVVREDQVVEIDSEQLVTAFPSFRSSYGHLKLPNPENIIGCVLNYPELLSR